MDFIPDNIIEKYDLTKLVVDGYVYILEIMKDMYGLKQAAILANRQLVRNLAKEGYRPISVTSDLWKHRTRKTHKVLCIDDFGVKYHSTTDLDHFIKSLENTINSISIRVVHTICA